MQIRVEAANYKIKQNPNWIRLYLHFFFVRSFLRSLRASYFMWKWNLKSLPDRLVLMLMMRQKQKRTKRRGEERKSNLLEWAGLFVCILEMLTFQTSTAQAHSWMCLQRNHITVIWQVSESVHGFMVYFIFAKQVQSYIELGSQSLSPKQSIIDRFQGSD